MTFDGKVKTLEDLMKLDSGFAFKSSEWVEIGTPVIKIRNVQDGYVDLSGCSFVGNETAKKASSWYGEAGNTLIALTGAGVGEIGRIRDNQSGLINQRVGWVRPKDSDEEDYIYYLLRYFKTEIIELASGSAQPNVSPKDILRIPCTVPIKAERIAIGAVLSILDEKIVLNNALSKTLEEIAQTIFKSWFIDFDPVRAKMAGETPVGMDSATAGLFPDSMEESDLGLIPRGWKVEKFGEVNNLLMGQSPPGDTYNSEGEGLPFYQGRTDFGFRFPKQRIFCTKENRVALPGETLISVRAPVGDVNQAIEKCIIGRGVASALHKSNSEAYTFSLLKSLYPRLAYFNGEGTVFGAINRSHFNDLLIVEPATSLVERFEDICGPMNAKIRSLFLSTEALTQLRDSLLPRLISGELQIPKEMLAS
jgi:type I restriction enzyme, S subunit